MSSPSKVLGGVVRRIAVEVAAFHTLGTATVPRLTDEHVNSHMFTLAIDREGDRRIPVPVQPVAQDASGVALEVVTYGD
jgi:hypothetical protein